MKKHTQFLFCLLFTPFSIFCQTTGDLKLIRDGVLMREGKAYKIEKNGSFTLLSTDYDLGNGTKVSKTGDVAWLSGAKTKLREGEGISRTGALLLLSSQVIRLQGYIFKEGKVFEIKDKNIASFDGERILADSNRLTSDGRLFLGNTQKYIQLSENEIVSPQLEVYLKSETIATGESYVMKRNGSVIKSINSRIGLIDSDYLLPNGTKVTSTGLVTTKEGLTFTLNEGDKLTSKGELYMKTEGYFNNAVAKKNGAVFAVKNGKLTLVETEQVFDNGTKVDSKGFVSYPGIEGRYMLKEGDLITQDGQIYLAPASPADDKSKKERFIFDHIIVRGTQVMMVKDGEPSLLSREMLMPNGNKVSKAGLVTKPTGFKYQMKNGERMDMNGELLPFEKPETVTNPDKNYLTRISGKMWIVAEGKPKPLSEDYVVKNKMIIRKEGVIEKVDGSKVQIADGDRYSYEGIFIPKDERPLTNQLPRLYFIFKNGKMWQVADGKPVKLEQSTTTKDQTKVLLDGTITKKNGTTFQLKENEKIDTKGEIITIK